MKCLFCGAENPEGVQVCAFCGQPIVPTEAAAPETAESAAESQFNQEHEAAQEAPTVSIEATRPDPRQVMSFEEPPQNRKKKGILIALIAVGVLIVGLVSYFKIRELFPSKSEVVGTYVLQSRAGKTAWSYVVDEMMASNPDHSREEIENYLRDDGVDSSKPESILCLKINEDGTCEMNGYLLVRGESGTWTLKGNTVSFEFPSGKAEATYKKGKISSKLEDGTVAVYTKMD